MAYNGTSIFIVQTHQMLLITFASAACSIAVGYFAARDRGIFTDAIWSGSIQESADFFRTMSSTNFRPQSLITQHNISRRSVADVLLVRMLFMRPY